MCHTLKKVWHFFWEKGHKKPDVRKTSLSGFLVELFSSNFEHFGAANGTNSAGSRFTIFHGKGFKFFYVSLSATLNTVHCHKIIHPLSSAGG